MSCVLVFSHPRGASFIGVGPGLESRAEAGGTPAEGVPWSSAAGRWAALRPRGLRSGPEMSLFSTGSERPVQHPQAGSRFSEPST